MNVVLSDNGRYSNNHVLNSKAIAIMLMVLGHSQCSIPYVTQIIYMFHMPLFFFFSGFCFKEQYISYPKRFVWRRIKGIYWPYVKWSLVFLALHNVFYTLNVYNVEFGTGMGSSLKYENKDFIFKAYTIITHMNGHDQLLGGYWFLRALFVGSLFAFMLIFFSSYVHKRYGFSDRNLMVILIMVPLFITMLINQTHFIVPFFHFGSQPTLASVFFILGYVFKKYKIPRLNKKSGLLGFAFVIFGSFFWRSDTNFLYYDNVKMIPFIITAVVGSWCVYSFNWTILGQYCLFFISFVGQHTLEILTWHFLCFKFVSLCIICIYGLSIKHLAEFPVIGDFAASGWWLAYFSLGVALPLFVPFLRMGRCKIAERDI